MKSIVRHRVYGADKSTTIYYFVGYKNKIGLYWLHIQALRVVGYRIFAFEYDPAILNVGEPENLLNALGEMSETINKDKTQNKAAGVYGISLGSWLRLNIMHICNINNGILVAGGASIVDTIWDKKALHREKGQFELNGYSKQSLASTWQKFDFKGDSVGRIVGKQLMVVIKKADEIIDFKQVNRHIKVWSKSNSLKLQIYQRHSHSSVIFRALASIIRTIRFLA